MATTRCAPAASYNAKLRLLPGPMPAGAGSRTGFSVAQRHELGGGEWDRMPLARHLRTSDTPNLKGLARAEPHAGGVAVARTPPCARCWLAASRPHPGVPVTSRVLGPQVGDQYKPAELARGEWPVIQQGPPWAVDAWGLGCLTQEVFAGSTMTSVENLR